MPTKYSNSISLFVGVAIIGSPLAGINSKTFGQILPPLRNSATENRAAQEVPAVQNFQSQPPQGSGIDRGTSKSSDRFWLFGNRRIDNSEPANDDRGGLFGNSSISILPRQQAVEESELERRWQPFRVDSRSSRFDVLRRPGNTPVDPSQPEEDQKKNWEPMLKLGQMGNMRSARRFEMESRPSPFDKRPQVFFDPDSDQNADERGGLLDRFSQRSQQTWSNTTSWFSERNQKFRQRANQSWQNFGWSQQADDDDDDDDSSSNREGRRLFPGPFTDRQQNLSDRLSNDRF